MIKLRWQVWVWVIPLSIFLEWRSGWDLTVAYVLSSAKQSAQRNTKTVESIDKEQDSSSLQELSVLFLFIYFHHKSYRVWDKILKSPS